MQLKEIDNIKYSINQENVYKEHANNQYNQQILNFKTKDDIETKINDNKLSDATLVNKICDNNLEASINT